MDRQHVDIEGLARKVLDDPLICKGDGLCLWGGKFAAEAARLHAFLAAWDDAGLSSRLFNHVHRIGFDDHLEPDLLEHACLFGAGGNGKSGQLPESGGDLELRREGQEFLWRYIGREPAGLRQRLEEEGFTPRDFWQEMGRDTCFRLGQETALLWGEKKNGDPSWQDDRVAGARLNYPLTGNSGRAELSYLVFSDRGQVAFVWWQEVRKHG